MNRTAFPKGTSKARQALLSRGGPPSPNSHSTASDVAAVVAGVVAVPAGTGFVVAPASA